jgi:hypothetical protein
MRARTDDWAGPGLPPISVCNPLRVALLLIAGLILFFDVYKHDVQFKRMT